MGGGLILLSFISALLCWSVLSNALLWWLLFVTFGFALIGFADDALKLRRYNHAGLNPKQKMLLQMLLSGVAYYWLNHLLPPAHANTLHAPLFKNAVLHLGILFPFFVWLVLTGSANAVNLTDGLDGLAVGPVVVSLGVLGIIAYCVGHKAFATYLYIPYIFGAGELLVAASAMIGACLGFLWYNAPPASVFMGDTGSMAMGGFLGGLALITKHELILALVGGIFVIETCSVMIQVLYFKCTGKRIFLMAPLHHHFEQKGWSEPMIVMRFWIISLLLGVVALATLKVR